MRAVIAIIGDSRESIWRRARGARWPNIAIRWHQLQSLRRRAFGLLPKLIVAAVAGVARRNSRGRIKKTSHLAPMKQPVSSISGYASNAVEMPARQIVDCEAIERARSKFEKATISRP